MATGVNRRIAPDDFAAVRRSAYFGGVDFFHRWQRNTWQVKGHLGGSSIGGSPSRSSSPRSPRRGTTSGPDQSYVTFDPTATSLRGTDGEVAVAKEGGTGWAALPGASPLRDSNQRRRLPDRRRPDPAQHPGRLPLAQPGTAGPGRLDRRQRQPEPELRRHSARAVGGAERPAADPSARDGVSERRLPAPGLDDRTTRGGPLFRQPGQITVVGVYQTDTRRVLAGAAHASVSRDGAGRPPRWWRSISPSKPGTAPPSRSPRPISTAGSTRSISAPTPIPRPPAPTAIATSSRRWSSTCST